MPRHESNTASPVPADALSALESSLRRMIEEHDRLLHCLKRKREAIRVADMSGITEMCGEEKAILRRIGELDARRQSTIAMLARDRRADPGRSLTISEIAAAAREPASTRLLALAAQLRDRIAEVRRSSSVIRAAAEALSRHMTGLMQTVQTALSRARVYGQRGRIDPGAQVQFSLDVRT
jgi:glycine cleavage system regulatory protein